MADGGLVLVLILVATAATVGGVLLLPRLSFIDFRRMPGFAALTTMAGQAIESDQTVHVSLGNAGVGEESTLAALAGLELLAYITERAAIGDRSPAVTTSSALGLAVAQDTLRVTFRLAEVPGRYDMKSVVWLPNGPSALAFGAGAANFAAYTDASANVLVGRFGPEMAFITDVGIRRDMAQIAGSDLLEGQAVAYAMADMPLVGEEMFAAGAYLEDDVVKRAGLFAQDLLRLVMIVFIVLGFILASLGG